MHCLLLLHPCHCKGLFLVFVLYCVVLYCVALLLVAFETMFARHGFSTCQKDSFILRLCSIIVRLCSLFYDCVRFCVFVNRIQCHPLQRL